MKLIHLAAAAAISLGFAFSSHAADVTVAVGQTGDSTAVLRLATQFDFGTTWWQSDVGHLTGYWDAGYTYWNGDNTASNHSLSFSPVLVYEFSGQNVKPYIEFGIGVAAFASTEVENNDLGSAFQFEDRFGVGLRFAGGHEVGVRATHYSNAGLTTPNDGVESYALHYTMPL